MSKKTIVAVAAAAVVAAYGAGTWYSGAQAEKAFAEAVAELRHALGKDVVVTDAYDKGFFSAVGRLTLEVTPSALQADAEEHDGDETETEPAADAAPAAPVRLVVTSDIRHGPLAGGKVAAAVVQSRFAVEGADERTKQAFAKASMPTMTVVRHLLGSSDWRVALPAGEFADDGLTVRWSDLAYDVALGSDKKTMKGEFKWPELALAGLSSAAAADEDDLLDDDGDEGDEIAVAAANGPDEKLSFVIKGMGGNFDIRMIDGLWGAGPGKMRFLAASTQITTQRADAQPEVLADFKEITADTTMEADAKTLSISNQLKTAGRIGPMEFESLTYDEKIQRLDIEALRSLQQLILDGYRKGGLKQALEPAEEQLAAWAEKNAPQMVQALPAYNMKLQASYQGSVGEVAYGLEVLKAPTAEEVADKGWMLALVKGGALNASARLPKAWMASIAKVGGQEMDADTMDAMVQMATGSGFVVADGDFLSADLKVRDGQMNLNGEVRPLPMGLGN